MPEQINPTADNAAIASHDQPREPEPDQRQQGDNKAGSHSAAQPQHDESVEDAPGT